MNKETLLRDIVPKYFPSHYLENPWQPKGFHPYTYGDIPPAQHFIFDLILNHAKAYGLVCNALAVAQRTSNVNGSSHAIKHLKEAVRIALEEYQSRFSEEEFITNKGDCRKATEFGYVGNTVKYPHFILILAWINRDRFE